MSLNTTPAAERVHIGIFGKRKITAIECLEPQTLYIRLWCFCPSAP